MQRMSSSTFELTPPPADTTDALAIAALRPTEYRYPDPKAYQPPLDGLEFEEEPASAA